MLEQGVLYYGQDKIYYEVARLPVDALTRHARKVTIKVHPDQRVLVTAPDDAPMAMIEAAVTKRVRWVWQNIQAFAQQTEHVLPKRYVSGETQFYLGKRYVLKIVSDERYIGVKLNRGKLNVSVAHKTMDEDSATRASEIKQMVDHWYQQKAAAVFAERLQALLPKTTWVTDMPSFRIMSMQKRWGSCSRQGKLVLNPHLIKAPKECIDYVILHELCHIAEHNHSERFWRLLTQVMPNWKEVKARLNGMAELYLNA